MTKVNLAAVSAAATGLALVAGAASAQGNPLHVLFGHGNECEVYDDVLDRFEAENEGVTVVVDVVPYQAILENLPVQLAAGSGPDMAKVTDLGGLTQFYLDLSPYVDSAYWEASFGDTLDWYRGAEGGDAIYGMHSQLTITGAIRERHALRAGGCRHAGRGCHLGGVGRSEPPGRRGDRHALPHGPSTATGHRVGGPAISYGAAIVSEDGTPTLSDEGFAAFVEQFVAWNEDGTMARDVWAGQGGADLPGTRRRNSSTAKLVFYYFRLLAGRAHG